MAQSDKVELHTRFFNEESLLYSAMDLLQRQEHREKLASLIFEARARMNAVDDIDRQERAKLSKDGKEWLVTNSDVTVSNALNEPKIRKERMSKADKLKESLESLGLDIKDVSSIMGKVAESTSGGSITTDHNRVMKDNQVTFVKTPSSNNTQESLLNDVSSSLVAGIKDRPIEDLVSAAKTAGHIANKILGHFEEPALDERQIQNQIKSETIKDKEEFNPASLFG